MSPLGPRRGRGRGRDRHRDVGGLLEALGTSTHQ